MSDRVVVMNSGRIEQVGPPREIYRRPASRFVAGFVGRANFFDVTRRSADETSAEVELWGRVYTVPAHPRAREAEDLTLLVRPESLKLTPESGEPGPATAVVTAAVFMGDRVEYELTRGESRLLATVMDPAESQIIAEGSQVRLDLVPERAWLLPA